MEAANPNGTYTFASQPRAVQPQRPKYRNPQTQEGRAPQTVNMMYDPRIVRGNTYRQPSVPAMQKPDPLEVQRQQELARRRAAKKRQQQKQRPRTPKAVDGRKHTDVQTELYLEELTDRVEETEIATQTDAFLDRPPSPLFIPPKTGMDVATQILEGELFDFDVEVQPLLEVLIGKTMEQSLMEVMEEEELDRLRDHQREFESLRASELAEVQRMEEQAARREEEKHQRMTEQRQSVLQQKATAEKIAARAFAHSYLSDLVPSVFNSLAEGGFFYDRQEREIESQFMPWLMGAVESNLSSTATSRLLLDDILRNVLARSVGAVSAEPGEQAASSNPAGVVLHVTEPSESSTDVPVPTIAVEAPADDAVDAQVVPDPEADTAENADASTTDKDEPVAEAPQTNEPTSVADETSAEEAEAAGDEVSDPAELEADEVAQATEEADSTKPIDENATEGTEDTAQETEAVEATTAEPREVEPREVTLAEETQA
eukprot:m.56068 g.56068  ORF g.56068 m.56068 type:complete len:488 (+) comp13681_c0_seq1:92-1555(+)